MIGIAAMHRFSLNHVIDIMLAMGALQPLFCLEDSKYPGVLKTAELKHPDQDKDTLP
jgi:hypothetical protein